jgi:hypothetical protein
MKKTTQIQPMLHTSVGQLLYIFLTEKYITNSNILGLRNFDIAELRKNSFEMTGDSFYCLYEKSYRLAETSLYVNVKNYFNNERFVSNGVDLGGCRICTELSNFCKIDDASTQIRSIELLLDNSLDYGSLIINEFLDVRFGKIRMSNRKKKFHLTGISTDYELPSDGIAGKINTHGARLMKNKYSFFYAMDKFKNNQAIKELVMCVIKHFPHAISSTGDV